MTDSEVRELPLHRVQKYLNEAYSIYLTMCQKCEDIYYNGLCDLSTNSEDAKDIYGHYLTVGKWLYAIDVSKTIEDFGYNNYRNIHPEIGVEVIKFKKNEYNDDEIRYQVNFQINPDTNEFIELFDVTAHLDTGMFEASDAHLEEFKPEIIDIDNFKYISSGYRIDE